MECPTPPPPSAPAPLFGTNSVFSSSSFPMPLQYPGKVSDPHAVLRALSREKDMAESLEEASRVSSSSLSLSFFFFSVLLLFFFPCGKVHACVLDYQSRPISCLLFLPNFKFRLVSVLTSFPRYITPHSFSHFPLIFSPVFYNFPVYFSCVFSLVIAGMRAPAV